MSRLPLRATMVLSAFAFVGCASLAGPHVPSPQESTPNATARSGSAEAPKLGNEVSGTELTATGATTLYDALVRARRQYFAQRGMVSMVSPPNDAILVFRAGMLMGEMGVLKMMRPSDVRVVRRLSAVDTYYKYGKVVSVGGLEIELVNE